MRTRTIPAYTTAPWAHIWRLAILLQAIAVAVLALWASPVAARPHQKSWNSETHAQVERRYHRQKTSRNDMRSRRRARLTTSRGRRKAAGYRTHRSLRSHAARRTPAQRVARRTQRRIASRAHIRKVPLAQRSLVAMHPLHPASDAHLASLGPSPRAPAPSARRGLSGGSIRWVASPSCLASPLRAILGQVASVFGPVTVNSTCRNPARNRRVGGAPRSYHLTGNAVDFRVRGSYGAVLAYLGRQRSVGGLKHYGNGVFHVDTGPRRTWAGRVSRRG